MSYFRWTKYLVLEKYVLYAMGISNIRFLSGDIFLKFLLIYKFKFKLKSKKTNNK